MEDQMLTLDPCRRIYSGLLPMMKNQIEKKMEHRMETRMV